MYKNKTYLIIGGLGLIGKEFVNHILNNHGNVIVGDIQNNNKKKINLFKSNKNFHFINCDITNDAHINNLIKFSKKKYKTINGAIYCAYPKSKKWGTSFEKLQRNYLNIDINNNLSSPIIFSQKIIKLFLKQGFGDLIYLSSIQGVTSPKFHHYENTKMVSPIEYAAIKSGIISITRYLAKLYKKHNIRVNCISPGGIYDNQPKIFIEKYNQDCGNIGLLKPSDLVGALSFILGPDSKTFNGQNIIVDDGWSL